MDQDAADGSRSIVVTLTRDEALVLLDFLERGDDTRPEYRVEHSGEQVAIWHLQGQLGPHLGEVFSPAYSDLVDAARARLAIDLVK